uniref:Uncharacterized protein n=1 Tax=Oryza meridionalis TaxID=40149 RepID=A0A0E0F5F8_9ORYZ
MHGTFCGPWVFGGIVQCANFSKADFYREISHGPLFYLGSKIQGSLHRLTSRTAVPWRQHPP